ncbi:hypothetical protein E4T56_gene5450 [Termitomyces sp. T112]|nr:hypothetical protein E4T56_gene5450 [Termitomyces sp. T112]
MTSRTRSWGRGAPSRLPSVQLSPGGRTFQPSNLSSLDEANVEVEGTTPSNTLLRDAAGEIYRPTGGRPAPSPAAAPAPKRARPAGVEGTGPPRELSPSTVDRALRDAVPVDGAPTATVDRPRSPSQRRRAPRGTRSGSVNTEESGSAKEGSPHSPMVIEEEGTQTVVTLPDNVFVRIMRSFGCDVGKR